jgi:hypothetical protein
MVKGNGPFRLILNSGSAKEIEWHCKHYVGRGLMKRFKNAAELAKDAKIPLNAIESTFGKYNEAAKTTKDDFGRQFSTMLRCEWMTLSMSPLSLLLFTIAWVV